MNIISGVWSYGESSGTLESVIEKMCLDGIGNIYKTFAQKILFNIGFSSSITLHQAGTGNEIIPLYLPEKNLLFVSQARIDNRLSLCAQLGIPPKDSYSDDFIVLKSFLFWGKECVNHLSGAWSFAVFDYCSEELFIARDTMSYTSLYYYQDSTGFYFSSSIKSLLALPHYKKQLNELHLIRNLTFWDRHKCFNDTYFENISALPQACTLNIKNKQLTLQKYWHPENIPFRYYRKKKTYIEEISYLFRNAVNNCLHGNRPVAAMLSGGLDSSTVSYTAAEQLEAENKLLTAFSHVPYFTDKLSQEKTNDRLLPNETPFINQVVRASGNINPLFIQSGNSSILKSMLEGMAIYSRPLHGAANLYWLLDIYRTVAEQGFGCLLTGEGGNGSISFAGASYLLSPLKISRFFRHPLTYLNLHLRKPLINFYTKKKGPGELYEYVDNSFLHPSFIKNYNILEDISQNNKDFNTPVKNINDIKKEFIQLYAIRGEFGAACSHHFGIELRDPCTDKELMEYCFSIPNEIYFDVHYNNRMLVKRMMKGKIPDEVLFTKKIGLQSGDIFYRVKAQQEELTEAFERIKQSPAAAHYIDTDKLFTTWKEYLSASYVHPYQVQPLLKSLHFGLFLQSQFD